MKHTQMMFLEGKIPDYLKDLPTIGEGKPEGMTLDEWQENQAEADTMKMLQEMKAEREAKKE